MTKTTHECPLQTSGGSTFNCGVTTLTCKKKKKIHTHTHTHKTKYCDHPNKNNEHPNLRITKIWIKKKKVTLHSQYFHNKSYM